jgi:ATP-binding cassette subfamily B protein
MFKLLLSYKKQVVLLIAATLLSSGLGLLIPRLISQGIDNYGATGTIPTSLIWIFSVLAIVIVVLSYAQSLIQNYVAELVGKDLRRQIIAKVARQSFDYVQNVTPSVLLTNLTSDVDSVKNAVGQVFATMLTSGSMVIGAAFFLLITDWQLALIVIAIVPVIAIVFALLFSRIRKLFKKVQGLLDQLNRVINESIWGASLVRILHTQQQEQAKFEQVNNNSRDVQLKIISYFSWLIPFVSFMSNIATLLILLVGGNFVIRGDMSLGEFTAFNSYVQMLIYPVITFSIMSNIIARSVASYTRIQKVLTAITTEKFGSLELALKGNIELKNVTHQYEDRAVLHQVSFVIKSGSRTAIIGPTGAGKSQLLYVLSGLISPNQGEILYDQHPISKLSRESFYRQLSLVFQDSSVFNLTLKENIAFNEAVTDESLATAIETAELNEFIDSLPKQLQTVVSERGASMSGGQKQRLMLARALAVNPTILLLDDFTARVDRKTEQTIMKNLRKNYPNLTLIQVSQIIASVEDFDQIIFMMEGEIIATGTHSELLKTSPDYVQLYNSQKSINTYE